MDNNKLQVIIDGKVYRISGGSADHMQKVASYVDNKISELKLQAGYNKLTPEYQNILLALNLAEELFKAQEEITIFNQEHLENEQELYRLKQDIVDKDMRIDTANRLVIEYKPKVNELQKRIIELETRNGIN